MERQQATTGRRLQGTAQLLLRLTLASGVTQQIGQQSSTGIELAFAAEPVRGWTVDANAAFLRNSYVVGATRNIYLDLLGLIMVGGTIGGVSLHGLLRILAARRRKS